MDKLYVIGHSKRIFDEWCRSQFEAKSKGKHFIYVDTPTKLRENRGHDLVVLGPFWRHPYADELLSIIRQQTSREPLVMIQWFPL